jgi:hypothetical protein
LKIKTFRFNSTCCSYEGILRQCAFSCETRPIYILGVSVETSEWSYLSLVYDSDIPYSVVSSVNGIGKLGIITTRRNSGYFVDHWFQGKKHRWLIQENFFSASLHIELGLVKTVRYDYGSKWQWVSLHDTEMPDDRGGWNPRRNICEPSN